MVVCVPTRKATLLQDILVNGNVFYRLSVHKYREVICDHFSQ